MDGLDSEAARIKAMKGRFIKRKICQGAAWLSERPYYLKRFYIRKRIGKQNFSIIANNCWAGRAYQYLGMPYLSPTVGLYFFAEEYIKFVMNLRYYLSLDLQFIPAKDSRYHEELRMRNKNRPTVPIGILDDVEIVFLHYKSEEEAKSKWNRRLRRINYDDIILKFSNMNLCTDMHILKFDTLPFQNKFMLNYIKRTEIQSEIYHNGSYENGVLLNDTDNFPSNLDLIKLLSGNPESYPAQGFLNLHLIDSISKKQENSSTSEKLC